MMVLCFFKSSVEHVGRFLCLMFEVWIQSICLYILLNIRIKAWLNLCCCGVSIFCEFVCESNCVE